jgi:hypothetical protein
MHAKNWIYNFNGWGGDEKSAQCVQKTWQPSTSRICLFPFIPCKIFLVIYLWNLFFIKFHEFFFSSRHLFSSCNIIRDEIMLPLRKICTCKALSRYKVISTIFLWFVSLLDVCKRFRLKKMGNWNFFCKVKCLLTFFRRGFVSDLLDNFVTVIKYLKF